MERITQKQVRQIFKAFCEQMGFRIAKSFNDLYAMRLDYNSVYGGYVIEKICNEHGGVSCPFGHARRSAREMTGCMFFAMDLAREKNIKACN